MTRICAWCQSPLRPSDDDPATISHGICPACALQVVSGRGLTLSLDEATLLKLLGGELTAATACDDGKERRVWLHLTAQNFAALRHALDEAEQRMRRATPPPGQK